MKAAFFWVLIPALLPFGNCRADLIKGTGRFENAEGGVSIEIEEKDGLYSFLAVYPDRRECGISKIKVVEGKWAAQFVGPNCLWVYDGKGGFHLCERTSDPEGCKGTSVERGTNRWKDVPDELKAMVLVD